MHYNTIYYHVHTIRYALQYNIRSRSYFLDRSTKFSYRSSIPRTFTLHTLNFSVLFSILLYISVIYTLSFLISSRLFSLSNSLTSRSVVSLQSVFTFSLRFTFISSTRLNKGDVTPNTLFISFPPLCLFIWTAST